MEQVAARVPPAATRTSAAPARAAVFSRHATPQLLPTPACAGRRAGSLHSWPNPAAALTSFLSPGGPAAGSSRPACGGCQQEHRAAARPAPPSPRQTSRLPGRHQAPVRRWKPRVAAGGPPAMMPTPLIAPRPPGARIAALCNLANGCSLSAFFAASHAALYRHPRAILGVVGPHGSKGADW